MDGVSFPAECTDDRIDQNAMYCGYDCDTMVNNVFAYGPDGKVFFAAINFPGSWADGSLTARFLNQMKRRTRVSLEVGMPMVPLSDQSRNEQHDDFIVMCVTISSSFLMCIHLFGKQASGECEVCKVPSLDARNACQVTPPFVDW